MTGVEIAISVAAKILEYSVAPILKPFGYIFHHKDNIDGLRTQVLSLEYTQSGVQQRVDVADRNGEIVLPIVKEWLARANRLASESEDLLNNETGTCPNLKLIYRSSRKAKKNRIAVDELLRDGKFDHVSRPAPRPPLWPTVSGAAETGDLGIFESRKTQLESIMEALQDDDVSVIGVYGMGGIGKTTFVEEAAKQADAHKLFDEIVMVVISQKPNLRKIQGDLAEMLDLNLKQESEILRTARLRERLNQVKRILVILDDVWAPLDLMAIGIPQSNIHRGCKLILTSRSLDVCNAMNSQRNFYIDVLSELESWTLFRKMSDDTVDSSDLHPIATKVSKRCSGLPLAIVTVARALRHRSKHAWRDALHQLQSSTMKDVKGMHAKVFSSLELSFNFLKDEEAKSCFLLCSLFKEDLDIPLEYLVRYGMGLRVFQNVHTLEEARDRVHTLVETLKACCLLLDGDGEECFRLHDVTRDFLLSVASRGRYIFLEKMMPMFLESPNNRLGNSYAVSVVLNDLEELPIGMVCPKLRLLRLEGSSRIMRFSGDFFEGMKELKVIVMHHVSLPSIPPSFLALRKLLTLCLEHCKLGDLSLIKELKHLEVLSFMSSEIEKLPEEVGELSRLKLLDLTDCKNLKLIPFGVFSKLCYLECLYMNSFVDWGIEGQNKSQSRATLAELKHLSRLSSLEMQIPDANLFPRDLIFGNLIRFKVLVGMDLSQEISYSYAKTLRLSLYQGVRLHSGIYTLLKDAQHLILDYSIVDYLEDLHSIVYDLRKDLGRLRCLEVYGYTGVESLIDTNIFPVLEKLKVVSAADLNSICYDHLPAQSFSELRELMLSVLPELTRLWNDPLGNVCLRNLRTLYVSDCHKLEDLLLQSTARNLLQLQKLHVSSCENLKVILSKDSKVASNNIVLSKLRSLELEFLPSLMSFCPETDILASDDGLEAPIQEPLFNTMVAFPVLEELTLREVQFVKEIWQQQIPATNFCGLRILVVYRCDNLVTVFPSDLQGRLQNLEKLSVEWCDSVEEVCELKGLVADDEQKGTTTLATLPYLRDLILGKLPQLKRLWWNIDPYAYISLHNLSSLHIYECDFLSHLFSLPAMRGLIQLQELKIHSCKMMKSIFENEEDGEVAEHIVLHELCFLKLEDLPELSSFYQGNHNIEFPSLVTMEIKGCPKMKAFVTSDVHRETNNGIIMQPLFHEQVALPELQELYLIGMNSLIHIWQIKLPEKSFCKLRVLEVIDCDRLIDLAPINVLPRLQMLERLYITNCDSLEVVFTADHLQIEPEVASFSLINLVELVLDCLPRLRNIWWDMDSHKIQRFQGLSSIEVTNCGSLDCIFPHSVARGLLRLQKLKVDSCQSVKQIVRKHGEESKPEDEATMIPQIHAIELENLPNLVSFCTRSSPLKWLYLKELRIVNCCKMASFLSTRSVNDGAMIDRTLSNGSYPFFVKKVVFPSLEKLRIDSVQGFSELWHSDIAAESFCQLRVLEVRNCNNLLKLIPLSLLPGLQNLEEISVNQCRSLEKILEWQEDSGDKAVFPKVHTVRLINIPKLGTFHLGDRSLQWPNLERITLEDCPSLQTDAR